MKCSIPEISWHNREPVLSVDFQPINTTNNDFYRLATSGSDSLVLIWKLTILPDGQVDVKVLSELTRHQRSVNVVKWSPNGELLASGDDDANIILWQLRTDNIPSLDEREDEFEEKWNAFKVLRGHKEDVYDLCWSPSSDKLLSGSVDNSAILWDVMKGKSEHIIKDHKGFIQGVAWDPKSDLFATLCSDRICRVFDRNGRRVRARIGRGKLPVDEGSEFFEKEVKYFHDDTFKTYFRRLNFTPDGSLLLVPSGAVETDEKKNALFGTFAFTLDALNNPVCVLPSGKQCSIAVKCCPILFTLRENGPKPLIKLPYRMIIAVATDSDVILYDTQQLSPCVHLQNIHYTRLTDLTWSVDGLLLAASSTDGFITLITFEEGELGAAYVKEESDVEDSILNMSGCDVLPQDETEKVSFIVEEVEKIVEKPKKPSFLEQWSMQAGKRKPEETSNDGEIKIAKIEFNNSRNTSSNDAVCNEIVTEMNTDVSIVEAKTQEIKVEVKKRRITPIQVSKEVKDKGSTPLSSPTPSKTEEKVEVKPKRRIQLIKVGEVVQSTKKTFKELKVCEHTDEININLEEVQKESTAMEDIIMDDGSKDDDKLRKITEKSVEPLQKVRTRNDDGERMPAPTTPKNKQECIEKAKATPVTDKLATPTSASKKTPKQKPPQPDKSTSEKTSSSKKKKQVQPSNTLFNYMKPISKTPSSESKSSGKVDIQKSDFKPLKLFGKDVNNVEKCSIEESNENTHSQIKVAGLIKPKVTVDPPISTPSEDTATDLPDDFILRVEDDVVILDDDSNECTEKENGVDDLKDIEVKPPGIDAKDLQRGVSLKKNNRRIPLITLSSPKNKKKPKTAE